MVWVSSSVLNLLFWSLDTLLPLPVATLAEQRFQSKRGICLNCAKSVHNVLFFEGSLSHPDCFHLLISDLHLFCFHTLSLHSAKYCLSLISSLCVCFLYLSCFTSSLFFLSRVLSRELTVSSRIFFFSGWKSIQNSIKTIIAKLTTETWKSISFRISLLAAYWLSGFDWFIRNIWMTN